MTIGRALALTVAFAIGNLIWQAMNDGLWSVAAERTFFQGWAIFTVWLLDWFARQTD